MKTYSFDQVTFALREPHDLSWLKDLGHVFKVFDEQDSGNICFGVEENGRRKFVKYAGAKPQDFNGDSELAVERLRKAVPLYKKLAHHHLIHYHDDFATENGYVLVFDWFDGECLHPHWAFPPPVKYTHPDSPYFRYRNLPLDKRMVSFDTILSFHTLMEAHGYVAVDLYDGSILYDFDTDTTKICDIDFYEKGPVINDVGEDFWGSTRSKSPEEYLQGAVVDHRSNVFTLGTLAFSIFGGETDRSITKWDASAALYQVASKAVEKERENRFLSIQHFKEEWDNRREEL